MSTTLQLSAIRRKYCGDWLFYRSGNTMGLVNPKFSTLERLFVELSPEPEKASISGEIIKDSRSVLAYIESENGFFIKFYRRRSTVRALRYSFFKRKRSSNSLISALNLSKLNIQTPQVIAVAQVTSENGIYRGDYLITENIAEKSFFLGRNYPFIIQQTNQNFTQLIDGIAAMCGKMHQNGIFHGDLSLRNIYYSTKELPESYSNDKFGLIDLDGTENHHHPLSLRKRQQEMARVISSFVKLAAYHQLPLDLEVLKDQLLTSYKRHSGVDLRGNYLDARITYLSNRARKE